MTLSLERLGNGAAYVVHDEVTGTTLLLGCGEAKEAFGSGADGKTSTDDGSGYDSTGSSGDVAMGSVIPPNVRQYTRELKELMRREGETALSAVLIPDYRPEACYMLPFLTEKCKPSGTSQQQPEPAIYLTHATRAIAPHLLTEYWTGFYGKGKEKLALFDGSDIQTAFRKTTAVALKACITVSDNLKITAYHAGHVAGGCAFFIEIGATTILYANDFNLSGSRVLMPAQIPRLDPCALITSSSFAVPVSETKTNMERDLMKVVLECLSSNGKVVIPVYRLGFFHELATILLDYWKQMNFSFPIYLSDEAMEYPSRFTPLLRKTCTDTFKEILKERRAKPSNFYPELQKFDWKRLQQPGPFVLFSGPANISQGDSFRAVKSIASDPKNLIVLSEHCTPGTVNYMLYADPQHKDISKKLGVTVSCGVHYLPCGDEVDAKSIVELAMRVAPRQVLLDYVIPEDMELIKTHLRTHLQHDPEIDNVIVNEIAPVGATAIQPSRDLPLRIHKSMFNNPSEVQGMLIAEAKRKLMLVTTSNGARRLKKKRHLLNFTYMWKKAPEPSTHVKKRSSRAPSSALSFLLSGPAESADEDEPEQQPQANVDELLRTLNESLSLWIRDITVEKIDRWLKMRSVGISVSPEWEVFMEWSYEDEELAGRILGIAKQVINSEYAKQLD